MQSLFMGCITAYSLFWSTEIFAQASLSQGIATYYNDKWVGKPTSSGEILDKTSFTCAHSSYPMGTLLKLTNPITNDAIVVRVNNKQAKNSLYIATVTRRSAEIMGMLQVSGKMLVTVEMVEGIPVGKWEAADEPGIIIADFGTDDVPKAVSIENMTPPSAIATDRIRAKTMPEQPTSLLPSYKKLGMKTIAARPAAKTNEPPETTNTTEAIETPKTRLKANEDPDFRVKAVQHSEKTITPNGFGVQMGAMDTHEKAIELVSKLNNQDKISDVLMTTKSAATDNLYKIMVGPFEDITIARQYREACKKNNIDCFIVDLTTMQMMQ